MSPSTSTLATSPVPTFESLGLRPLINCYGTYTIITGSRLLKQAADAMVEATNHYVNMDDLMEAVGRRLAELTGAEWGYIPSGCAAALTQLTAACLAGGDPEKMTRLPETAGLRNEVIMQRRHRNSYDWAIRMTGARMVEVETVADLKAALSERTAMIAITGNGGHDTIPVEEMIALGHERGVICIVDAAAQRPDVPNRYLQMGADAVCYSGGKCLRGPQASGLVLGRRDLLWAAFLNGAPHHALGRPMKAGKEEIMGLLAAVEAWVQGRDHEAEWRMWEGYLEEIRAAIADLPSLETSVDQPGLSNHAPMLRITWDPEILHCTPEGIYQELLEGDPPIITHRISEGLRIMPYMMERGDAEIVARRLSSLLKDHASAAGSDEPFTPPADVNGIWQVTTHYVLGQSVHSMVIEQDGELLKGRYRAQFSETDLQGQVRGDQIEFRVRLGYQINTVRYVFKGSVDNDSMSGEVSLGEFGTARWSAQRSS
jgi:D-glucosaminate-6-phosphate ammonia-lyase